MKPIIRAKTMGMNFTDIIIQFCTLKNFTDKPDVKKNQNNTPKAISIIAHQCNAWVGLMPWNIA
jgi:hypothetical protein